MTDPPTWWFIAATVHATIWDDDGYVAQPPLQENLRADCCVIGLGGSGLAAIAELIAHGRTVVGLDAGQIGGGAAGKNAGFLIAGLADFFDDVVRRFGGAIASGLYRHTQAEIQRMAAAHPDHVRLTGSLRIAASPDEVAACEAHRNALQGHGFAAERYAGPEGVGALIPDDGVFHPLRCLRAQAQELRAAGAQLFEHSPVTAFRTGEVTTSAGQVACDSVIIAIDGRLEQLVPELRGRMRTARLQMLATAPARDVSFPRPVYWRHGYEYWQQLPTGEIALGGFRDRGGEAEWTGEATPGDVVQSLLEQFLREQVKTTAAVTRRWAGCVGYSADRLPVLEQVRERVYALGAYGGTGNIVGRLCGRAAARLACGEESEWADLLLAAARSSLGVGQSHPLNHADERE